MKKLESRVIYSRAVSRVLCSDNKHSRFGQQQLWKKRLVCIQSYIRSYDTLRYRRCKNNRSNTPRAERPTGVCWQSHSGRIPWILSHLIIIIWHLRDTRHGIRSHVLMPLATYSFPITSCRRACESWTWHVFFQMGCQHDPTCWWSATLILNLRLWSSIRWHNRGSLNESMVHVAWRYFHRWRLLILRSDKLFVGTKFLGKKNYMATDRLVAAACLACSGSLSLSLSLPLFSPSVYDLSRADSIGPDRRASSTRRRTIKSQVIINQLLEEKIGLRNENSESKHILSLSYMILYNFCCKTQIISQADESSSGQTGATSKQEVTHASSSSSSPKLLHDWTKLQAAWNTCML